MPSGNRNLAGPNPRAPPFGQSNGMIHHIRDWLNQPEIDRALAQGLMPAPGTAVGRRARRLTSRRSRRALARGLDRLAAAELDHPSAPCLRRAPDLVNHAEIRRSRRALAELAQRLRGTGPEVRIAATASWLLTSPDSPVYRDGPAGSIEAAIRDL